VNTILDDYQREFRSQCNKPIAAHMKGAHFKYDTPTHDINPTTICHQKAVSIQAAVDPRLSCEAERYHLFQSEYPCTK
jgi:hypothetical protein